MKINKSDIVSVEECITPARWTKIMEDIDKLIKALEYAIQIIESYELNCKDLENYIKEGYDINGFCQGTIYKKAIKDIKKIGGIK